MWLVRPFSIGPVASAPYIVLTVAPTAPTIPADTPLGTVVALLSAVWSNGAPFTGTYVLTNDVGGTYAISGNTIIINPVGPGVSSAGGTLQNVVVIAVQ